MSLYRIAIVILTVTVLAVTTPTNIHVEALKNTQLARVEGSSYNALRRLSESLNIGDNPNEDIRTNRLLNMEGI